MNIRIERSQKHGMMPPSDQLGFGTVFTDHMFLMDYTDPADAPAEGGEASAGEQTSADGTACRGFVAPDPLRLRA